jgi:4-hydroxy-tetrahydrodipicolinate synthase
MSKLAAIKGSIPPVITPFRDGAVDYEAYAGLINFQVAEGSHGILVNGTTAEPSTLTTEERNRLVDIAIETVNGRVPVVAATGSQSLAETEQLTAHAAKAGADALLIVTPYYIRPPQRGLIEYYLRVASQHETPWMIYHIPGRTAINVTLDSLKELRDKSPTFVGMKHAVNDLGFVTECLSAFGDDFKIFVGLEELSFPMMTIGACGLMNAVGNLRPSVLSDMCQAVWDSDLKKGRELHQRLLEINQAVFYDTNPIPMKYMMKRMGLMPANEHRLPMMPASAELEKRLDGVLERAGLLKGIAA